MLSWWDKFVIGKAARTRREACALVRASRLVAADAPDSARVSYVRVKGWRMNVAQAAIVTVHRRPTLLLMASGAVLLYLGAFGFTLYKHL